MARTKRSGRNLRVREKPATGYASSPQASALNGVLLDSDVVIEVLRGRRTVIDALRALERDGVPTFCTAVTWAEVHAGLRRGEEQVTQEFFEARGEVVLDARTGRRAGDYLLAFARSHGVELADALIAAAAATAGLSLWTLNRKHYPMRDLRFHEPHPRH